jgi:hypothetical protein
MLIAVLVLVALVILGVVAYIGGEKNVNNSKSTVKRQEKNEVAKKLAHAENLLENWADDLMPAKKAVVVKGKAGVVKSSGKKAPAKKTAVKKVAKKAAVKKVAKKAAVKKVAKKTSAKKVAKKASAKKTTKR